MATAPKQFGLGKDQGPRPSREPAPDMCIRCIAVAPMPDAAGPNESVEIVAPRETPIQMYRRLAAWI